MIHAHNAKQEAQESTWHLNICAVTATFEHKADSTWAKHTWKVMTQDYGWNVHQTKVRTVWGQRFMTSQTTTGQATGMLALYYASRWKGTCKQLFRIFYHDSVLRNVPRTPINKHLSNEKDNSPNHNRQLITDDTMPICFIHHKQAAKRHLDSHLWFWQQLFKRCNNRDACKRLQHPKMGEVWQQHWHSSKTGTTSCTGKCFTEILVTGGRMTAWSWVMHSV